MENQTSFADVSDILACPRNQKGRKYVLNFSF